MTYPILAPGTLAKPQTSGGRFQWLPVLRDPGPANRRDRRITLLGRKHPVVVRRDRVHTFDSNRTSRFDTAPTGMPKPVEVRENPAPVTQPEAETFPDIPALLRRTEKPHG